MATPSIIALIPARQGSKRIKGKNVRELGGHPLIAYTIASALESGVFGQVVVSTDSPEIAAIARHYGASVPFLRPAALAGDRSPDVEWVEHALTELAAAGQRFDCFSILRPTSPFRSADTLRRAWKAFWADPGVDSLRAVEKCSQHPGKMWVIRGQRLLPLLPFGPVEQPWHSTPYQALPLVFVQNASLEIAWSRVVLQGRSIAGETVLPFVTNDVEGFDLNDEYDWQVAEAMLRAGVAALPRVSVSPFRPERERAA